MDQDEITRKNAEIVEKKYGIPKEVYLELCTSFANSKNFTYILDFNAHVKNKIGQAFAFGLILGYLKSEGRNDLIEKIIAKQN